MPRPSRRRPPAPRSSASVQSRPGRRAAERNRICAGASGRVHRHIRCRRPAPGFRHLPPHRRARTRARRFRPRQPVSRTGPGPASPAPPGAARGHGVHAPDHGLAAHRYPQRPARHDAQRRLRDQVAAEPHGACIGVPRPDRPQRVSLRRAAGHDRVQRLFTCQGAARPRRRAYPARPVRAKALSMIAQLVLSALLAGILLYAWTEYRRSPAVALLTVFVASAGMYFVWVPQHSTQLAELVGIGRGVDLILYIWVCISLIVLLNLHLKLRTQMELITTLARRIALADPQPPKT